MPWFEEIPPHLFRLPAKAGGVLWGKFFWPDHTYTRNWTETTEFAVDPSCILKQ